MNGLNEGSLERATKKVRQQEEDPLDDGGREDPMDPFTPKMVSFRDMVMNSSLADNSKEDS
ncbi:hypothetical protein Gorai_022356 [Gossypium raimondii]|uniref:Uncharacterized protein n=1 Tax=Gossypium raimondii TaxID=29730 RepID=A0A7J8NTH9_GOSRA|nr:hypothetical protein [Gossypium raimondii]